jgi:hypothetical protein
LHLTLAQLQGNLIGDSTVSSTGVRMRRRDKKILELVPMERNVPVGLLNIFFINFKLSQLIPQLFTQYDVLQVYKRQSTSSGGGRSVEQGSKIRSTSKMGNGKRQRFSSVLLCIIQMETGQCDQKSAAAQKGTRASGQRSVEETANSQPHNAR